MKVETIKTTYTFTIALIVIMGGLWIIYQTRLDPPEADVQGLRLLLSGFVGAALQFVFNRESSAGSAFQSERAYAAGLAAPTIPNVPIPNADATTTTTTTKTTASEADMTGHKTDAISA